MYSLFVLHDHNFWIILVLVATLIWEPFSSSMPTFPFFINPWLYMCGWFILMLCYISGCFIEKKFLKWKL